MNGTAYLMDSQILRRRLFSIGSHFFGANSLGKNVSEKQHVFCLADTNPIRTPTRACSAWRPHFDQIEPRGCSIRCESDKDDNWGWGRGGIRQQSADGGKQNWRVEMRRQQTGEQATNWHETAIAQCKPPT